MVMPETLFFAYFSSSRSLTAVVVFPQKQHVLSADLKRARAGHVLADVAHHPAADRDLARLLVRALQGFGDSDAVVRPDAVTAGIPARLFAVDFTDHDQR
jgi:hypothetical protein